MIAKRLTPEDAMARAEALCARAEHCSGEIAQKLYRWGITSSDSERIIDSLIDRRFIDDRRFAAAFVRDKVEYAAWGRRKIALALAAKRLDRDIVAEALEGIDPEVYAARLAKVLDSKRRSLPEPDTTDGRARLFRHAVARGFEPSLVADMLRRR